MFRLISSNSNTSSPCAFSGQPLESERAGEGERVGVRDREGDEVPSRFCFHQVTGELNLTVLNILFDFLWKVMACLLQRGRPLYP